MHIIPRCENKDAFKWLIIQIVSRCRARYNVIYKSCVYSSLCGRFIIGRLELQQCVSTYGESLEMRLSTIKKRKRKKDNSQQAGRLHDIQHGIMSVFLDCLLKKERFLFNKDKSMNCVCVCGWRWERERESTSLLLLQLDKWYLSLPQRCTSSGIWLHFVYDKLTLSVIRTHTHTHTVKACLCWLQWLM